MDLGLDALQGLPDELKSSIKTQNHDGCAQKLFLLMSYNWSKVFSIS